MSKKIVVATVVIERRKGGAEISAVELSPDARRSLSTAGAEIEAPELIGRDAEQRFRVRG